MIDLKLNEQMVTIVMEALSKMPLERTFDTFVTIRSQIAMQQAAAVAPQGIATNPPPPPETPKEPPVTNGTGNSTG